MRHPNHSYLVCASQRSGSTLLCRALSETGVAGHPEEYFLDGPPSAFPAGWEFWERGGTARRHGGVGSRREYLDLVYRIGTTPNGVFGAKLMWNNVVWAVRRFRGLEEFSGLRRRADVFRAVFPNLAVVHLVRRDVVRQAVSWARAAQDGRWVVSETEHPGPTGRPEYSYELIADLVGLLLRGERGWTRFYRELGLTSHKVVYEDLLTSEGYRASVLGVLRHLGLEDGVEVSSPGTSRQADALNEGWVQRFLTDADARNHPMLGIMLRRHLPRGTA
jgi:trehalose 2-sulfotransferase